MQLPEERSLKADGETNRLAKFISGMSVKDLPQAVKHKLLLNVADTLGVTFGADEFSHVKQTVAYVGAMGSKGAAIVIGQGFSTSPADAAFANGVMAHACDYDDAHKFVHPGCAVVPAVLALAQARNASGQDTVAALAAGYETAVRVALAAGPAHRNRDFHPTGTCGVFGAAAGAARIIGLSARQTASALGLAASMSSGITRYRLDGSANKHLHGGLAARNGVDAALLAEQGMQGATNVFEAELGFLETFAGGGEPEKLVDRLGKDFQLVGTDIKPFPSCRQTHGAIELALGLQGDEALDIQNIERIEVSIYSYANRSWYASNEQPGSWLEALLRIPYCVAVAFLHGQVSIESFFDDVRSDPRIHALLSKISVVANPQFDENWPAERPVHMRVICKNGNIVEKSLRHPISSQERPVSVQFIFEKFASLLSRRREKEEIKAAFKCVLELDHAANTAQLMGFFGSP